MSEMLSHTDSEGRARMVDVGHKPDQLRIARAEGRILLAPETTKLIRENLIKKGVVIATLLDRLIVTKGVKQEDLVLGDKNAVLVAARILAYGPEYTAEVTNPKNSEETVNHTFDLSQCPFKKLSKDVDYTDNSFNYTTDIGKNKIKFRLLTGKEEALIENRHYRLKANLEKLEDTIDEKNADIDLFEMEIEASNERVKIACANGTKEIKVTPITREEFNSLSPAGRVLMLIATIENK